MTTQGIWEVAAGGFFHYSRKTPKCPSREQLSDRRDAAGGSGATPLSRISSRTAWTTSRETVPSGFAWETQVKDGLAMLDWRGLPVLRQRPWPLQGLGWEGRDGDCLGAPCRRGLVRRRDSSESVVSVHVVCPLCLSRVLQLNNLERAPSWFVGHTRACRRSGTFEPQNNRATPTSSFQCGPLVRGVGCPFTRRDAPSTWRLGYPAPTSKSAFLVASPRTYAVHTVFGSQWYNICLTFHKQQALRFCRVAGPLKVVMSWMLS